MLSVSNNLHCVSINCTALDEVEVLHHAVNKPMLTDNAITFYGVQMKVQF